ncbi:MAG: ATP-binding protein [Candidatus Aenigmarchaeota archaeon]|nr:ATP-binding protein [Candidatus Aenigmarchaeota archaeon]
MNLGTVISFIETPSTGRFHFTIDKNATVRKGQFVQLEIEDGKIIGRVSDIIKTNRYFMRPEAVNEYQNSGGIEEIFPTTEWEYLIAEVNILGVFDGNGFKNSLFPPSPGTDVNEPEIEIIKKFFGLEENGIHMGEMPHHKLDAKFSLNKLFKKHLAILAISGAGKSYLTGILLEELLTKEKRNSPGVVIIDTHGEYTNLAESKDFATRVKVFSSEEMRIGFQNIRTYDIASIQSIKSGTQIRELDKILHSLKSNYSISDAISKIDESDIATKTKDVLLSHLISLQRTGIFGLSDYPKSEELVKQGQVSIIDMSDCISMKKKQILTRYFSGKIFHQRRAGTLPPFVLILEEAHQYIPQMATKENALCRSILQTIAREGRKFNASLCLISQRPVNLSTTVLSQCNTKIILRVSNPYDIEYIRNSSEALTKDAIDQISTLPVGYGIVIGEAVNAPLLVKIRKKKINVLERDDSMEKVCNEFYDRAEKNKKDSKAFV